MGRTQFFFFLFFLILRETERERERERERENAGGTETGGERIPIRLHTISIEPNVGPELMNYETMT